MKALGLKPAIAEGRPIRVRFRQDQGAGAKRTAQSRQITGRRECICRRGEYLPELRQADGGAQRARLPGPDGAIRAAIMESQNSPGPFGPGELVSWSLINNSAGRH